MAQKWRLPRYKDVYRVFLKYFGKMFYKKGLVSNDHTMDRSLTRSGDVEDECMNLWLGVNLLKQVNRRATELCLRVLGVDQEHIAGTKNKYLDTNDYAFVI